MERESFSRKRPSTDFLALLPSSLNHASIPVSGIFCLMKKLILCKTLHSVKKEVAKVNY